MTPFLSLSAGGSHTTSTELELMADACTFCGSPGTLTKKVEINITNQCFPPSLQIQIYMRNDTVPDQYCDHENCHWNSFDYIHSC